MQSFLTPEELEYIRRELASPGGKRQILMESIGRAFFTAPATLLALLLASAIGAILYGAIAHLVIGMKATKPSPEAAARFRTFLYWGLAI
jgi:hypothetical protein